MASRRSITRIQGAVTLAPSFHGAHQWDIVTAPRREAVVHVVHRCVDPFQVQLPDEVWRALVPSRQALLRAETSAGLGLDGMRCDLGLRIAGRPLDASIWGLREARHGALFRLVDGLWEALYAHGPERYRPYLEHVAGYFRQGLPVRWLAPNRVRLYGRLTCTEREPLGLLLDALPTGSTLDMSNFEGMGTQLHPLFLEASQRAVAHFVVNAAARVALRAAGVRAAQLEATREGPHRTGLRRDVTITQVACPDRAAQRVAELCGIPLVDARRKLQRLPCWLGAFDAEDLEQVVEMLRDASVKGQVDGARYVVVAPQCSVPRERTRG